MVRGSHLLSNRDTFHLCGHLPEASSSKRNHSRFLSLVEYSTFFAPPTYPIRRFFEKSTEFFNYLLKKKEKPVLTGLFSKHFFEFAKPRFVFLLFVAIFSEQIFLLFR